MKSSDDSTTIDIKDIGKVVKDARYKDLRDGGY